MLIILFTILAISGAICVSVNKPLIANYFWVVSNIGFILICILNNENELLPLFIAYELIAICGIYNLKLK